MKLHFEGKLGSIYWGNEIPKGYKSDWISFTCLLHYKELNLLKTYINNLQLTHCFHPLVDSYWCISMPERDAMQFRLHFPCPSSSSGAMKDFAKFEL